MLNNRLLKKRVLRRRLHSFIENVKNFELIGIQGLIEIDRNSLDFVGSTPYTPDVVRCTPTPVLKGSQELLSRCPFLLFGRTEAMASGTRKYACLHSFGS